MSAVFPVEPWPGSTCAVRDCNCRAGLLPFLVTLNPRCERAWATIGVCPDHVDDLDEIIPIAEEEGIPREAVVMRFVRHPDRTIIWTHSIQGVQLGFADLPTKEGEYWRQLGLW